MTDLRTDKEFLTNLSFYELDGEQRLIVGNRPTTEKQTRLMLKSGVNTVVSLHETTVTIDLFKKVDPSIESHHLQTGNFRCPDFDKLFTLVVSLLMKPNRIIYLSCGAGKGRSGLSISKMCNVDIGNLESIYHISGEKLIPEIFKMKLTEKQLDWKPRKAIPFIRTRPPKTFAQIIKRVCD